MKKVYEELARIQRDLKAPKNLYNNFGKYKYRNAESILEAVKPLLNGLVLLINDEPVLVGERFYIRATVTLTDGEDSVSATAYAREDEIKKGMDGCQVTGACSSYARKYALNALLMIDDSKDSDSDELSPQNPNNQSNSPQNGQRAASDSPVRAEVTTGQAVPQTQNNTQEMADGMAALKVHLEKFTKDYGDDEKHTKFYQMRKVLIDNKQLPDKKLSLLTVDEINRMMQRIYANYPVDEVAS